jgi:hypothetical protein
VQRGHLLELGRLELLLVQRRNLLELRRLELHELSIEPDIKQWLVKLYGPLFVRLILLWRILLLLQCRILPLWDHVLFLPRWPILIVELLDIVLHVQRRNVLRPRRNMVHELPVGPDVEQRRVKLLLNLLFIHVMHLLLRTVGLLLLRQYLSRRVLPNGLLGLLGLLIHCGRPEPVHSLVRGRAVPLWI